MAGNIVYVSKSHQTASGNYIDGQGTMCTWYLVVYTVIYTVHIGYIVNSASPGACIIDGGIVYTAQNAAETYLLPDPSVNTH